MTAGPIIIYLNWLGNRQAVSVRPIGLSCVEAVKDWVASLRQSSEPFEISGLKSLSSGQTIWAEDLPDQLGPGIPQHLLLPGADYEVIIGAPRPVSTVAAAQPFSEARNLPLMDPGSRIYPVAHPFRTDSSVTNSGGSQNSNVYYVDKHGNRLPGPGPAGFPQESTLGRNRSHEESIERPYASKADYSRSFDEGFDPNLRTVYRKMTPEDLDCFVYRMYAPYKHSAPRRDIYDEKKEMEKRMYTFRDDIPSDKPPMIFSKESLYDDDDDLQWSTREPLRRSETDIEATHLRLYEAARKRKERQRQLEESRLKVETAPPITCSQKLKPDELKAMKERLTKPRKPPPDPLPENVIGSKPVKRGELRKNLERWSKPRAHHTEPELPNACNKKKVKVDYKSYKEMMARLNTPLAREREYRKEHPVLTSQERTDLDKKRKAESAGQWKHLW